MVKVSTALTDTAYAQSSMDRQYESITAKINDFQFCIYCVRRNFILINVMFLKKESFCCIFTLGLVVINSYL